MGPWDAEYDSASNRPIYMDGNSFMYIFYIMLCFVVLAPWC